MSDNIWYPHYVGDYNRKTSELTMLEHGAYRLLLDHYYATGKPLTDDMSRLFRICRAFSNEEQDAIAIVLQLFFKHDAKENIFRHKRVDEELKRKAEISEKRSQAAKNKGKIQSANAKQLQSKSRANAEQLHTQSQSQSQSHINNPLISPKGDFDALWFEYKPYDMSKGSKKKAKQIYDKILKNGADHENIIRGCREYIAYCHESGCRTQHVTTWLNGEGWEFERPITERREKASTGKPAYSDTVITASQRAREQLRISMDQWDG